MRSQSSGCVSSKAPLRRRGALTKSWSAERRLSVVKTVKESEISARVRQAEPAEVCF